MTILLVGKKASKKIPPLLSQIFPAYSCILSCSAFMQQRETRRVTKFATCAWSFPKKKPPKCKEDALSEKSLTLPEKRLWQWRNRQEWLGRFSCSWSGRDLAVVWPRPSFARGPVALLAAYAIFSTGNDVLFAPTVV